MVIIFFVALLAFVGLVGAVPALFFSLINETIMFFYDNAFYAITKQIDSSAAASYALFGVFTKKVYDAVKKCLNRLTSALKALKLFFLQRLSRFKRGLKYVDNRTRFLGGSYAVELTAVACVSAACLEFYDKCVLGGYAETNMFTSGQYFFCWFSMLHIIIANFFI